MAQQPVDKFKIGSYQVSKWEREISKDGQSFTSVNYSVQRSYLKNDEWINQTISVNNVGDAAALATVARKIMEDVLVRDKKTTQNNKNNSEAPSDNIPF